MKNSDLKKLRKSGEATAKKRTFFLPLVYFNAAKQSFHEFRKGYEEFETMRDWFLRNVQELDDFVSVHEDSEITPELMSFLNQWPEGFGYDVEGAMTEIHAPLANSISHYFNLVTNCVAALEACTNQLIAKLLASGDIQEATIASWRPAGIGNRPRHLLEWLNNPITDESETKQALEVFSQIVSIRNNFVHYKPMPVTFTYEKLSMADVVGDDNVNPEFCYVALKSISFLLDLLTQDKRKFRNTFHIARMGFSPGGWPSPYVDFHD